MSNSQKRKRVQDEASDHETEIKQTKSNNPNLFSQHLNKVQLIDKILNFARNHVAIKQHTPKWRELMKTTIGGSEIGILFGYSWRGQPRLCLLQLPLYLVFSINARVIWVLEFLITSHRTLFLRA
jgi:hypothetical protein